MASGMASGENCSNAPENITLHVGESKPWNGGLQEVKGIYLLHAQIINTADIRQHGLLILCPGLSR